LVLISYSTYEQRKKQNPDKEPDMSDVMNSIKLKSRDNARTPMQWDTSPNSGFTGSGVQPWLKLNEKYTDLNVYTQKRDPDSVLNYFRTLIGLRKQHPLLVSLTDKMERLMLTIVVLRRFRPHQPNAQADLCFPARSGAFPDACRVQLLQRRSPI
jgi:glycosidase